MTAFLIFYFVSFVACLISFAWPHYCDQSSSWHVIGPWYIIVSVVVSAIPGLNTAIALFMAICGVMCLHRRWKYEREQRD